MTWFEFVIKTSIRRMKTEREIVEMRLIADKKIAEIYGNEALREIQYLRYK